jgi:chromosome segregation ATPase
MESLVKSLLGKGQEHVYETMQTVIENAEKKENLEIQLEEAKLILKNVQEENEQNKKKIRDLKSNIENVKDTNEELVEELEKREAEIRHLKSCVKNRDDIADSLDEVFNKRTDEINELKSNFESLASQVGKELVLEKKLSIQHGVIKELKENLRVETSSQVELAEDIDKLVHDIKELENRNDEKAESLEKVLIEKDMLLERLQLLEERNKELLVNVQKENLSLAKELSLECTFKCKFCEDNFVTGNEVKVHERRNHENHFKVEMLRKLSCLEKVVAEQKYDFLSKVLALKEQEKAYNCTCKRVCNIKHKIYNWTRSKSDDILSKSENAEVGKVKQIKFGLRDNIKQYSKNPWGLQFLSNSDKKRIRT